MVDDSPFTSLLGDGLFDEEDEDGAHLGEALRLRLVEEREE